MVRWSDDRAEGRESVMALYRLGHCEASREGRIHGVSYQAQRSFVGGSHKAYRICIRRSKISTPRYRAILTEQGERGIRGSGIYRVRR